MEIDMANSESTTSSRALLGAAVFGPVAAMPASAIALTSAGISTLAWNAAVQKVTDAQQAMDRAYEVDVKPVLAASETGAATIQQVNDAEHSWGIYPSALADAINEMTVTPAPSVAAVAYKVETARKDGLFDGSSTAHKAFDAITEDLCRLGGVA
jgi:hypothetical protein